MLVMPQFCKKGLEWLCLRTGQNTLKSNFFCQENLTKPAFSLENRDTYPNFTQMGINKGAALGTMMMGALVAPDALAEDKTGQIQLAAATSGVSQQVDCVAYAKEGENRADKKQRLKDCRLGKLDDRIAEQERVLAELNNILAEQNMRIDKQGRIMNELDQEIARVVAINGKLLVERQQVQAETAQILDNIEAFIRSRG